MLKSIALLLAAAICSTLAQAPGDHRIEIRGGPLGQARSLYTAQGTSLCVCLANTPINSIQGFNAGSIKLFTGSDCTGKYQRFGGDARVSNAQGVKSVVFGSSGIQRGPDGCPNYLA
ncbi:hypothetical protein BG003_004022 [Podila horticola]|nr:hypothetical protein BG003_004022 [Podila horticola]